MSSVTKGLWGKECGAEQQRETCSAGLPCLNFCPGKGVTALQGSADSFCQFTLEALRGDDHPAGSYANRGSGE